MIRIIRGPAPEKLAKLRDTKLVDLRRLIQREGRPPHSDEIDGYRKAVADALWVAQHEKCCFCEMRIHRPHNDVEHYRPKAGAQHGDPHGKHDGYWWLAFTWDNLLFSCKSCNEEAKGIRFPLTAESIPLRAEHAPPRGERPLLIDPASECGIAHIEFKLIGGAAWKPVARNGSAKGLKTIWTCALDRDTYVKLYTEHVNRTVRPYKDKVEAALRPPVDRDALTDAVADANLMLLRRSRPFAALSYDALHHFIPPARLAPYGLAWRPPP